ncbi:MAG: hypothetical protein RLT05_15080, partial [Bauldia litoralis]
SNTAVIVLSTCIRRASRVRSAAWAGDGAPCIWISSAIWPSRRPMQGAPSPAQAAERTRLARRMQVLSTMTAVLLVVTTALMAVGRYA